MPFLPKFYFSGESRALLACYLLGADRAGCVQLRTKKIVRFFPGIRISIQSNFRQEGHTSTCLHQDLNVMVRAIAVKSSNTTT